MKNGYGYHNVVMACLMVLVSLFLESNIASAQAWKPDKQHVCNSCTLSNSWRNACPQNECCSALGPCGPEKCCHQWATACDEYSCWQYCANEVTHYCGEDHHSCTVKCGHWCHTCPEWVLVHGECPHTACQYCTSDPHSGYACENSTCDYHPHEKNGNVLDYYGCG